MSATRKVPQSGQLGQAGRQASTTLVGRHSTPLHPTLGCGPGRATRPAVMVAAAVAGSLCAATRECSRRRAPSAWRRAWTALSIPASGGACCCSVICWTSSAGSRVTGEWAASGPRAPTRCTSSGEQGLGLGRLWETLEQFGAFRCNCACLDCRAGLAFYCCTCACLDCRAAWRSIAAPVPAWIAERPGVLLLHLCLPGLQSGLAFYCCTCACLDCRAGLLRLGFGSLAASPDLPDAVAALETRYEAYRARNQLFFLLRSCLAPATEACLLVDRLLYLREAPIADAHLTRLFDPLKSPRCFALVANK
jgi:hypothetical protein